MLTFGWYLLKVIACSGILYTYYLLLLRNKIFHSWNRFFLLFAVIVSLTAPIIKINIIRNTEASQTHVVQLLQVVSSSDEMVFEYSKSKGDFKLNVSNFCSFIYIVVSSALSAFLMLTLLKIHRLKKHNRQTIVEGINFINTNVNGTPFSFFNTIFWNDKIDISTLTGKQIFLHEVAHVHQKHSYDKLFINIILIFSWCNPFFWLIRRELNMLHEFIADGKAVQNNDTTAFALMILQATYPQQKFTIVNNFYSPLKRRLIMLRKNRNSKITYGSRLVVLPLVSLVFFAFSLKMKTNNTGDYYAAKKITVLIDAGHGGADGGAKSENGIYEKNLTLSIAKQIRELNDNTNLTIVLSRNKDEDISIKERVNLAQTLHADMFISIHLDAEENKNINSGLNIVIPNNGNSYFKESNLLGSEINAFFKKNYQLPVANELKQVEKAPWVLKANPCPSLIVEVGFISTENDRQYLTDSKNQQTIARNILHGIEKYAAQNLVKR